VLGSPVPCSAITRLRAVEIGRARATTSRKLTADG